MKLEFKILNGLERLSEVLKSLLWEKAKKHGISPIQINIILFVSNHQSDICNVSSLAIEFNVTKATISDAVRVLVEKKILAKDFSPIDNRRYNLLITEEGQKILNDLSEYSLPLTNSLAHFNDQQLVNLYNTITKLIFQLNQAGIILVQRTCFSCHHYNGNKLNQHFCNLLGKKLMSHDLRLDCKEFEALTPRK